jgi:hypothetical protein
MRATERLYELWNLPPSGVEWVQKHMDIFDVLTAISRKKNSIHECKYERK